MNTGKFQLDRAGWRKVLISVFIALILYGGTVLAMDCAEYHRVSLRLENLSNKPMGQVQQQDATTLQTLLKIAQEHRREDMTIHASAILFGVLGLIFVERKTRK